MSEPDVDVDRALHALDVLRRYVELTHPDHLHRCPVCEAMNALRDEETKVRAP